jgi:hypothetical protein
MNPEIELLIQRYKQEAPKLSQRELAERELFIWQRLLAHKERGGSHYRTWISHNLGADASWVGARSDILALGPFGDELWHRVTHEKMSPSTASWIVREAKRFAAENQVDLSIAISKALGKYDKMPTVLMTKDGFIIRRSRQGKKGKVRGPKQNKRLFAKTLVGKIDNDRAFWKSIRRQVKDFLIQDLRNSDPIFVEGLVEEFSIALRQVNEEFRLKIKKAREEDKGRERRSWLSHEEVSKACQTLQIDPPIGREPVDLKVANRQKRRLLRVYHPDAQGSTDVTREMYHVVLQAYEMLEKYNEQVAGPQEPPAVRETTDASGGSGDTHGS